MASSPVLLRRAVLVLCGAFYLSACDGQAPSKDAPNLASDASADLAAPSGKLGQAGTAPPAPTMAPSHLSQQPPIIREAARVEKPRHVGIHTPPPGSADRVALMNALRGKVRNELGGDVIFVVTTLHSDGEWAFAQVQPTWPDGRAIRMEGTPAYRDNPNMDGLRTEALWHKERGRWSVVAHAVGSTDVWWLAYCARVPKGVMRGCEA